MSKSLEKAVRNPVIRYAKKLGIESIRMYFGPGIQTGWPDDLFLIAGGRPLFIEFKAPGNTPTKKQEKKMKLLKDAGYDVNWTDSVEEGKYLLCRAVRAASQAATTPKTRR